MRFNIPLTAGAGVLALLGYAGWLWLAGGEMSSVSAATANPVSMVAARLSVQAETLAELTPVAFANVPGGQDAKVPGRDPLLSADLIRVFEQILSRCTVRDRAGLGAQAQAQLPLHVPPVWLVRAQALLTRYLDYREVVAAIAAPDGSDLKSLRRAFDARAQAQARYFAAEELDGLFGAATQFDRFSLERLELMRNPDLTPEQRTKAIQQAELAWLTPAQREQRQQFTLYQAVEQMSQDMVRRGLTDTQAYAERAAVVGPEAAQRLGQLDQSERDWQTRLSNYAQADAGDREALVVQLFSEPERLRLVEALALRELSKPTEKMLKHTVATHP